MNERGFALVTVLWLVAALSVFVGGSMATARLDLRAIQNRIVLERAEWAAEACAAILSGRFAEGQEIASTDTVDLGGGAWCRASIDDPSARLNINTADTETLNRFFMQGMNEAEQGGALGGDQRNPPNQRPVAFPQARPRFAAVAELRSVDGIDEQRLDELLSLLTVRGAGRVNLMTAHERVVRSLSMLTRSQADRILMWRRAGYSVPDHAGIATLLEQAEIPLSAAAFRQLVRETQLSPTVLVIEAVGGLRGLPIRGARTITVVPVGGRLAVLRREVQ